MQMKKILLSLTLICASLVSYAQTCPTPSTTAAHVTLDSTYQTGTYRSGKTNIGLCWYNNTSTNITATQFRVFYDKTAFAKVDTVTSLNTSFSQYLQYVDNPTGGYVTITLTYTGNNSSFTLPNGKMFQVTLKHSSVLATTYFTPTDMTFGGTPTFPQLSTTQAGADYALTLKNFGGVFKPQVMSFKGKFVNVTGTPSKNLTVSLEKKLKTSSTWSYVQDTFTNSLGKFFFTDVAIDTTVWDVRIAVKGDTMGVGAIVSTSDAQRINQYVLGTQSMTGFDYYSSDVNGDNSVSISDVYGVYARVSGRFTTWSNSVKDVKFFTVSEYDTINGSSKNYTSTIAGVTNFTYQIIAGQPDSVTYYVVCPGDANGTGYNRARLTPIQIVNPNNANKHIIDVTTAYDNILETIEVNYPKLGVDAGDVVRIPVKLKTGGIKLGSLQICMKYDSTLLTFKGVKNEMKTSYWISFINTSNNMVEWGGYDPSNNQHLVNDGDLFFTLEFESKKPQNEWGKSPLYVQRKFAGNPLATDLNITPTDGIIQVFRMGGTTNNFKDMILYPNPFEGDVTIGFKIYKEGKNIIGIYDINGKQQMEIVPNETKIGIYSNTVDLSFLPPGTYLAVLRNEEKTTTKKAVKTN